MAIKAQKWFQNLDEEEDKHKEYRRDALRTYNVYTTQSDTAPTEKKKPITNVLGRVVECQVGAVFSATPVPVVSKRFQSEGKKQSSDRLALVLERMLKCLVDKQGFYPKVRLAVIDNLVCDLGVVVLRYDDEEKTVLIDQQVDAGLDMYGQPIVAMESVEMIVPSNQRIFPEVISPKRFRWQVCKCWDDCDWVAIEHDLKEDEFKGQFKDADFSAITSKGFAGKKVKIHEIWSKKEKAVIYITRGMDKPIAVDHDLYEFFDGFPCPEPMWLNISSDKLLPSPEYMSYKEQAEELNTIVRRRLNIRNSIKDITIADKSMFDDMQKVFKSAKDGQVIPVDLTNYQGSGGVPDINNMMTWVNYSQKLELMAQLGQDKRELEEDIYQQTGIFDLMQGVSEANETATGQQLKDGHGNLRISQKRNCVSNHNRALFDKMSDIIIRKFTLESIKLYTGIDLNPEVDQYTTISDYLPDGITSYLIDVETGSTVARDKSGQQSKANEVVQTITQATAQLMPLVQQNFLTVEFVQALFNGLTKSLPQMRSLDDEITQMAQNWNTSQQTQQQMQQLQQQVQELTQQNQAMAFENQKHTDASNAQKMADADKKQAETQKIIVDTAQSANEAVVDQFSMVDENVAYNLPTIYNPIQ